MDTQITQFLLGLGGVVLLLLCIYLIPSIIAFWARREHRWIILGINIVFGGTVLGWVGALIWSIIDNTEE
jgi:hypothetical protein